jgi:hypothetical protein
VRVISGMSNEIKHLIDLGILKVAPVRARSAADVPRVRAALKRR